MTDHMPTIDEKIREMEFLRSFTLEDRENLEILSYEEKLKYLYELVEMHQNDQS